jgi:hypothetical protein
MINTYEEDQITDMCPWCQKKKKLKTDEFCKTCTKKLNKAENKVELEFNDNLTIADNEPCKTCGLFLIKNTMNYAPDNLKTCRKCRQVSDPLYRRQHIKQLMILAAARRAKQNNIDFDITEQDLPESLPEFCPVLGIPMKVSIGMQTDHSFSLDRIDNSKGYIRGNVEVISWKANRLKNNATTDDMRKILAYMEGRHIPT